MTPYRQWAIRNGSRPAFTEPTPAPSPMCLEAARQGTSDGTHGYPMNPGAFPPIPRDHYMRAWAVAMHVAHFTGPTYRKDPQI